MKRYVFDSYALLAFLEDEQSAAKVEKRLREVISKKAHGFLSVINWGEIYYTISREQGETLAEEVIKALAQYPLKVLDVDRELTKIAAKFKGEHKIAYADCFAAALAKRYNAAVLTGDPEFKQLEKDIEIIWLD